jgi:hypothetical protein
VKQQVCRKDERVDEKVVDKIELRFKGVIDVHDRG